MSEKEGAPSACSEPLIVAKKHEKAERSGS